jgi:hypothetical protein
LNNEINASHPMKTHLEFTSTAFPSYPEEDKEINPGIFGKRLAEFLAEGLRKQGFKVLGIGAEDWGWMVEIENQAFPLWIGCANYEDGENGFQCFIEPSKPFVRKWFSKIETGPTVEKLAAALEAVLLQSGKVSGLHWLSDDEARG